MTEIFIKLEHIPLIMVLCQCIVLAIGLFTTQSSERSANRLLALFLLLNAIGMFDALILWSEPFQRLSQNFSLLAYWGELAYWLTGPTLYYYCLAKMNGKLCFKWHSCFHLLPAIGYSCFIVWYFHSKLAIEKQSLLEFHHLIYQTDFIVIKTLRHLHQLVYLVICLFAIRHYQNTLKHRFSTLSKVDFSWLSYLVIGVALTVLWGLMIQLAVNYSFLNQVKIPGNLLGVIWNYLIFLLINAFVFYSLTHPNIWQFKYSVVTPQAELSIRVLAEKITQALTVEKIYLKHELTLDELAEFIQAPSRQVSNAINTVLEQNFFELVNSYRVEHAKTLLRDTSLNLQDCMYQSGFNSQSAFNRFFKKITHITPNQYRKTEEQRN